MPSGQVHFERVDGTSPRFAQLGDIFKEVLEPLYGDQGKALRKIAESSDRVCELMILGDSPVGVFQYKIALQSEHGLPSSLEVKSLFLVNAAKNSGKGLGSRLVERAEEIARQYFATSIHLTVSANCPSSREFFEKKGFKEVTVLDKEYIPGVRESVLAKDIVRVAVCIEGVRKVAA